MRGFAVVLATALCASASEELSLLQTASVKLHVAEQNDEAGKKECKASRKAFKELRTTMKADRHAVKAARDALKAAKLKRKGTRDAMKEAKANMTKACEVDPDDLPEDAIRPCVAQDADDISEFPRYRVSPADGAKHYSVGRASEPAAAWGGRLRSIESGGADMPLTYDIQKAFGVPASARRPAEDCAKGCGQHARSSWQLGNNAPSVDYCLQAALGSPNCVGMKSITFIYSGYQGGGNCFCTGGTKRAHCNPNSPAATNGETEPCNGPYDDAVHPAYKNQYSLTCMLPKRKPTDHSTLGPDSKWDHSRLKVCGATSATDTRALQDHSDKSILVGKYGSDNKGRASCADESWKNKKCREIATRMSVSKDGECRCEWGPLLISDQQYKWSLNGFTYGTAAQAHASAAYQAKWGTCLYPRALLKQGAPGEAFAMRIWGQR